MNSHIPSTMSVNIVMCPTSWITRCGWCFSCLSEAHDFVATMEWQSIHCFRALGWLLWSFPTHYSLDICALPENVPFVEFKMNLGIEICVHIMVISIVIVHCPSVLFYSCVGTARCSLMFLHFEPFHYQKCFLLVLCKYVVSSLVSSCNSGYIQNCFNLSDFLDFIQAIHSGLLVSLLTVKMCWFPWCL